MIRRTLAAFLVLICLSGGAAWGSISRKTVERAWARVAEADGFEKVPIHYEESDVRNAWVEFDSEDDYTVHVSTGLMGILTSEEEIAGILGHEIGHVRLGHYNRDVLIDIGRTLMGTHQDRMDDLARAMGTLDMDLMENQFSREQETEADDYGVELLVKAGYSPWGLYNAMKRFDEDDEETGGFDSHPGGRERLAHLAERARRAEKRKK